MKLIDFIDWCEWSTNGMRSAIKDSLFSLIIIVTALSIFVWGMNTAINSKEETMQQKKQVKKVVVATGIVTSKRIVKGQYTIIFDAGLNTITYECTSHEYGFFMKGDSYRLTFDSNSDEMITLVRIK